MNTSQRERILLLKVEIENLSEQVFAKTGSHISIPEDVMKVFENVKENKLNARDSGRRMDKDQGEGIKANDKIFKGGRGAKSDGTKGKAGQANKKTKKRGLHNAVPKQEDIPIEPNEDIERIIRNRANSLGMCVEDDQDWTDGIFGGANVGDENGDSKHEPNEMDGVDILKKMGTTKRRDRSKRKSESDSPCTLKRSNSSYKDNSANKYDREAEIDLLQNFYEAARRHSLSTADYEQFADMRIGEQYSLPKHPMEAGEDDVEVVERVEPFLNVRRRAVDKSVNETVDVKVDKVGTKNEAGVNHHQPVYQSCPPYSYPMNNEQQNHNGNIFYIPQHPHSRTVNGIQCFEVAPPVYPYHHQPHSVYTGPSVAPNGGFHQPWVVRPTPPEQNSDKNDSKVVNVDGKSSNVCSQQPGNESIACENDVKENEHLSKGQEPSHLFQPPVQPAYYYPPNYGYHPSAPMYAHASGGRYHYPPNNCYPMQHGYAYPIHSTARIPHLEADHAKEGCILIHKADEEMREAPAEKNEVTEKGIGVDENMKAACPSGDGPVEVKEASVTISAAVANEKNGNTVPTAAKLSISEEDEKALRAVCKEVVENLTERSIELYRRESKI